MAAGIALGLLAGLGLLTAGAYRFMLVVKPRMPRPAPGPAEARALAALEGRLMGHVRVLGGRIGERHLGRPAALRAAAEYIRGAWVGLGMAVGDEPFAAAGGPAANLVVEVRGAERPAEIVLVGAHYDSAPGTPGANDNATGVAVLLELARALAGRPPARTVRLVAFANEEPPYFMTEEMGSRVHARRARRRGDRIVAMLSLETLGYYSGVPGSQRYPWPLAPFYPDRGNFLAVVTNLASRRLAVAFLGRFMAAGDFPVEGAALPEFLPGVAWSDHWAFWREGYPALMLTDTAPFRYAAYHGADDVPDRIVGPAFARAAHGILRAVHDLAGPAGGG